MPTFPTPEPIAVSVEIGVGDIRLVASDRTDTVVEVRPSNPAKKGDVAAAEQTHVDFAHGRLLVIAPKGWRHWTPWGGAESVDVAIELPAGSGFEGETGVGSLRATGPLGDVRYRTGVGDVHLDASGSIDLKSGGGDVTVDAVAGRADIKTAGSVRVRTVDGPAVVKNQNGDTWVGDGAGHLRIHAANGEISIDRAAGTVAAKTANGSVRIGEVASGTVVAESAFGGLDVGVRDGVAAWLDLDTKFGTVRNELDAAGRPAAGEDSVEVRAHTAFGDVSIHKSGSGRVYTR